MKQKIDWSPYQIAIFKEIAKGSGNLLLNARAGSAKTTTIIEAIKYIPKGKKILVTAFNKDIQEELASRINNFSAEAVTLHSLGLRAIKQRFPKIIVDNNKAYDIIDKLAPKYCDCKEELMRCLSLSKATLSQSNTKIEQLIEDYDISIGSMAQDEFIDIVLKALYKSKEDTSRVNFDDMIYFPFIYNLTPGKYDYILIDESQDLNKSMLALIQLAIKKESRVIICADFFQCIYQFRGSNIEFLESMINKLECKTLALPICYRCPELIVKEAQKYVEDIQVAPNAILGEIHNITLDKIDGYVKPGDFILSRTNAPLIISCFRLLRKGIPANIKGKDIGDSLAYFIKKSKAKTIKSLITYTDKWCEEEVKKLKLQKRDFEQALDKKECIFALCMEVKTIEELTAKLKTLFSDNSEQKQVILSTVHKAKGAERDNVFIFEWTFRFGDTQNELNLKYVACTRSRKKLYYVSKN